jgi:photosystem II stability/assembly factor-like uncharacterized protein
LRRACVFFNATGVVRIAAFGAGQLESNRTFFLNMSTFKKLAVILGLLLVPAICAPVASAQVWQPMGPPGGDVRTLASDPANHNHLFLGTSDGHIFGSTDAGDHWNLLGRAGTRLDSVVTSIVVDAHDSRVLWAATWTQDPAAGGGVYRSENGGETWRPAGLEGHAVRALAPAAGQEGLLVAGAVDGVFRSGDGGRAWNRLTPEGHEELRNFDSVALDPGNPQIIYAGTYHLPWKTTDGGIHWAPVHEGMIDDSDVMSLLVDRTHSRRVYASACSGIYLSEDGAAIWRKIQGIPYAARRTQVILQDPVRASTVYAATTEGLWVTANAGSSWRRLTPGDWVVNAIVVLPGRIVIGTEKLGVLVSDDGGEHFHAANDGFYHREIIALALDREKPGRVLAVLSNAPEPLLATENGGQTWSPLGPGLATQSLRRVYASPGGWWAALDHGGLMRYDDVKSVWTRSGQLSPETAATLATAEESKPVRGSGHGNPPRRPTGIYLSEQVNDMAFAHDAWFAATDHGLLRSADHGGTWTLLPLGPLPTLPVRSVQASISGENLWVVSLRGMVFSHDAGKTWTWHDLPESAGAALWLEDAPGTDEETLVAGAENGLYISRDGGQIWNRVGAGLPQAPIQDLAIAGATFLASMRFGGLYLSRDRGRTWTRVNGTLAEGFFPVVTTEEQATTLFAASATEGLYAIRFANQE